MKAAQTKLSRRKFLLAATAGTAATAAAVVAKQQIDTASKPDSTESKKGYQLTDHVRNYYRTAKI
jgi:Rieske Fe-S protein